MLQTLRKKFIGDKAFYKMVLLIAVPIMVQNGITNFVNLLDNIMVGRIGTEQMSGVSIVNQLFFVFNLTIFGGLAGAGIFTAQFFGSGDEEGVRQTFRFKVILGIIITVLAAILFLVKGDALINMYLSEDGSGNIATTLRYGRQYLNIMLIGLPAFMMVQVYASTLRECGETVLPMKAGVLAVFVNLVFNYLLIYGKFGFPELGVAGAAIATVLSRYVELLFVILGTHTQKAKYPYIAGVYRSMNIPLPLLKQIIIKGMPLLINEFLWSAGQATLAQCYSIRGLSVVAALNITNTLANLFNIVYLALGDSVAIVVGQQLGAGNMKKARDLDNKMLFFSTVSCFAVSFVLILVAPLFPGFYNTTADVKELAVSMIRIAAAFMPMHAFLHAAYFTLRSGGRTGITFVFDNGYSWGVAVPLAFILTHYTAIPILGVYTLVFASELMKCVAGVILVKKGVWLRNIVA